MKKTLFLVLAALYAASPALHAGGFKPEERELVIKTAYETLARSMADSGVAVGFVIKDIRTLPSSRFHRVAWTEVVTLPGGDLVDVTRQASTDASGAVKVVYSPRWRLAAPAYQESTEGKAVASLTIAEVLARAGKHQPDASRAVALSTYQITFTLAGRSRTYRAAALWLPHRGGTSRVYFIDHITQGVEEVLREKPAPARPAPGAAPLPWLKTSTECQQTSTFSTQVQENSGYEGHPVSGRHWSKAEVEFACHCSWDCQSTCQTAFTRMECDDEGPTDLYLCHVMASNSQTGTATYPYGLDQGASCGAAFGCVEKACFACLCGLGVGIEGSGVNFSFNPSGNPDWNHGNFLFSHTCPKCEAVPEPSYYIPPGPDIQEPPAQPGPGGGGGCTTRCTGYQVGANYYLTCWPVC